MVVVGLGSYTSANVTAPAASAAAVTPTQNGQRRHTGGGEAT